MKKVLLAFITCLATTAIHAKEMDDDFSPWEILLFGGTAALDADDILIQASNIESDKAIQNNEDDWKSWSVQLGLGYIIPLDDDEHSSETLQWFPSIEPQFNVYFLKGNVNGNTDRFFQYPGNFSDNDFTTDLESTRFMFDVALTFASYSDFSFFGIAGIGPAINRVGYNTNEVNGAELHLDKKTQTNLAYEFGAGISYALSEHLSVTGEYLFTGFHNVELSENGTEGANREIHVQSDAFNINAQTVFLGLRFGF